MQILFNCVNIVRNSYFIFYNSDNFISISTPYNLLKFVKFVKSWFLLHLILWSHSHSGCKRKIAALQEEWEKRLLSPIFSISVALLHDKWPTIAINNNRYSNTTKTKAQMQCVFSVTIFGILYVNTIVFCASQELPLFNRTYFHALIFWHEFLWFN